MTLPSPPPVRPPHPRLTAQVLIGFMIIVVGVLFTLDNFGLIEARDYIRFWPAGLVLVGLVKLWHASRDGHGWIGGLFFFVLGVWMLAARIVYFTIELRELIPLSLVFLGGYMVWRGFGGAPRATGASDGQAQFSAFAIMGGVARRSSSQAFSAADLTAVMGGCEIDLRQASIAQGTEATIEVFAFWGGIEIQVPEDWTVVTRVMPLMGGVDDKTRVLPGAYEKRLIIRGIVVMGGAVVKNGSRKVDTRQG
jgi:predicted membrane protein